MTLDEALKPALRDLVREVMREELGVPKTALERDLLTYKEAADLVRVGLSTIKRWVATKALKTQGSGRLRRVLAADVRACHANGGKVKPDAPSRAEASVTSILSSLPRRA